MEPPPFPMRASLLNYSLHSFPKARKKAPHTSGEPFYVPWEKNEVSNSVRMLV